MTMVLKVQKFGDSLGLLLPDELLNELGVGEGDLLYPIRTKEGVQLKPCNEDFAEAMDSGRDFMKRHASAMRALAKE